MTGITRYIRKTAILAKLQTAIDVDAAPSGAANALKVFDLSGSPLDAKEIKIDYIASFLGASETLPGAIFSKVKFSVSLSGSGDAAVAPPWGPLLIACGFSELILTAPARVEYVPATDDLKCLTINWHDDGVLHKMLNAVGTVDLSAMAGEAPKLTFEFTGQYVPAEATPNPTTVLTAWKPPVPIRAQNVVDIKLGAAYAAGALTGGTAYVTTGLTMSSGNKVDADEFCSGTEIGISDREITGKISFKASAAEEVALLAMVEAGTLTTMGFEIGKTTGNRILIFAPAQRFKTPGKGEKSGKRLSDQNYKLNPVNGNDEVRLVSL